MSDAKFSFDQKCLDLAEYFIAAQWGEAPTALKHELAQTIQDAVECFFDLLGNKRDV